jgi:hypothetical protein
METRINLKRKLLCLALAAASMTPFARGQISGRHSVEHQFRFWGVKTLTEGEKMILYWGWTNGYFQQKGVEVLPFEECLENIPVDQAVAMTDKHYKNHPERWSKFLGKEMLEALTVVGGPCEQFNPSYGKSLSK